MSALDGSDKKNLSNNSVQDISPVFSPDGKEIAYTSFGKQTSNPQGDLNEFSLALMKDGTVRSWGKNEIGQLGDTTNTPRSTPVTVSNLSNVKAIATGGSQSLALLDGGTVRAWGYNKYGELGDDPNYSIKYAPAAVKNLTNIKNIDGGREFTLAVTQ